MEQDSIRISNTGFVWHELMSTDPEESERFYRDVAGVSVARPGGDAGYPLLIADGNGRRDRETSVGRLAIRRPGCALACVPGDRRRRASRANGPGARRRRAAAAG